MMKKLFFCLFLLSFLACSAQDRPQPIGSPKTNVQTLGGLYVDSALYLPTTFLSSVKYRVGALMYQQSDSSLYTWTGFQWLKQAGGAGSGSNLTRSITSSSITINNDNGSGVVIPSADGTNAGLVDATKYNFWDNKLSSVNIRVTPTPNKVDIESSAGSTGILPPVDNVNTGVMTPAMLAALNSKISSIVTANSITGNGTSATPSKLVNDVASPGADMVYGTDASGVRGWKPDPAGGGGGSQDVVKITAANLESATGLNTSRLYYVTDSLKQGTFYYVGTGINKTGHNGGTVIIDNNNNIWKRVYTGPIDARWFGAKADGSSQGSPGGGDARALIAAIAAAGRQEKVQLVAYNNSYYNIDTTVTMAGGLFSQGFKGLDVTVAANCFVTANVGFIIDGYKHRFVQTGSLIGMNTGGNDSTTYSSYTQVAVFARNAYECHIETDRITDFKAALQVGGKSDSIHLGSQYNKFWYNQYRNNYIQIWLTIEGTTTDAGSNWVNANTFTGGQLGGGSPATGTFGIKFEKIGGNSTSKFEANDFYSTGFEGLYYGIYAEFTDRNNFTNGRVEEGQVTKKFYFRQDNTGGLSAPNNILTGFWIYDNYFVPGGIADGTTVIGTIYSASTSRIGLIAFAKNGKFTIQGYDDNATAYNESTNDIISIGGNLDNNYNDRFLIRAKVNGKERFVRYLYNDTLVTASTFTVPMTYDMVYVNRSASAATVTLTSAVQRNEDEISIRNLDATQNVNVNGVNSGDKNVIGPGETVTYRSNGTTWYAKVVSGGGGSLTPAPVGSTPNDNAVTINNGTLTLQPADSTKPGVIKPGAQNLGLGKRLDSLLSRKITFVDVSQGFTPFHVYRTKNGLSFNDANGTPNPNGSTTVHNFASGSSSLDVAMGLGKTGVNFIAIGNNGTDAVFTTEKSTGGFEFRNQTTYNSFSLSAGNLRGKIFGTSGNWLIQSGGTATDAGYKLDVQGSLRTTGVNTLADLAGTGTRMVVADATGILSTQTIPSGGGGTGGFFTAGAGTGSPIYYSTGPVNIGVNPSQSYAWTHWGASTSSKALWEFSPSSAFVTTPRNHSLDYNGVDLRLTNGSGIPAKIITETSGGVLTGDLSYQANDISTNFIDRGNAPEGWPVVSNGVDGCQIIAPKNKLEYTKTSTTSNTGTNYVSLFGGTKTIPDPLNGGDVITIHGSGNIMPVAGSQYTNSWQLAIGSNTETQTLSNNYTSSPVVLAKSLSYDITITLTGTGTNVGAIVEWVHHVGNGCCDSESFTYTYTIPSGINSSAVTVNLLGKWNTATAGTSINSQSAIIRTERQ